MCVCVTEAEGEGESVCVCVCYRSREGGRECVCKVSYPYLLSLFKKIKGRKITKAEKYDHDDSWMTAESEG